jgi:hypothetical protein
LAFYKPEDIYDVQCPGCGKPVEFWKDDARRTCECGHRFSNPKRDVGCLKYCQHAEDCMPEMFEGENLHALYRDRLIAAIRARLYPGPELLGRLSRTAETCEASLAESGGDAKTAIAAALLAVLAGSDGVWLDEEKAHEILWKVGTEPEVVERVCSRIFRS